MFFRLKQVGDSPTKQWFSSDSEGRIVNDVLTKINKFKEFWDRSKNVQLGTNITLLIILWRMFTFFWLKSNLSCYIEIFPCPKNISSERVLSLYRDLRSDKFGELSHAVKRLWKHHDFGVPSIGIKSHSSRGSLDRTARIVQNLFGS